MNTPLLELDFQQHFHSLPPQFYSRVQAQGLDSPDIVVTSPSCAAILNIDTDSLNSPETLAVLSGNSPLPNTQSLAMKYTGHQFGYYNPELGDGRGLLLAEVQTRTNGLWDLHLKGAGRTPFSRQGDGRAVLRSSIREFLGSEAMAALGIPTSRALCVLNSKTPVYRETKETGANLLRVTQTHIRFGHFEFAYHSGDHSLLKALCDYTIKRHYPCMAGSIQQYANFFKITAKKTAHLIAKWQAFGFAHGVMNTDNMSILGETFDYGPFGFLDKFQPGYICNHSDTSGRYAFDRQPAIAHWNLSVLAQALSPLIEEEDLKTGFQQFNETFNDAYITLMRSKFGLLKAYDQDEVFIHHSLNMLAKNQLDYCFFFREISQINNQEVQQTLKDLCVDTPAFEAWLAQYLKRLELESSTVTERKKQMNQVNPKYILRNHLAQQAIELAEKGDYSEVQQLHNLLQKPFEEQPGMEHYAALPPDWAEGLEISCSS